MANSNFATLNPLTKGSRSTLDDGGLTHVSTTADLSGVNATMGITSGKWYWEVYINDSGSGYFYLGLNGGYEGGGGYSGYTNLNGMTNGVRVRDNGTVSDDTAAEDPDRWGTVSVSSTGVSTMDNTDVVMVALDYDNKKLWFGKNGTFYNSGNPATGTNAQISWDGTAFDGTHPVFPLVESYHNNKQTFNFGQDSSFAGQKSTGSTASADGNGFGDFYYAPPSGYLALCSGNQPTATGIDPSETDDDIPTKQFAAEKFTGNGGTQTIQLGDGFQPDCVWIKNLGTTNSWIALDSSRGYNKTLKLEDSSVEGTDSYVGYGIESNFFGSTGIVANDGGSPGFNNNTHNYIVYGWRANGGTTSTNTSGTITTTVQANQSAGFSIVTWTGTGTNNTQLGHGLTKEPAWVMIKNRNNTTPYSWICYHHNMASGGVKPTNDQDILQLNSAGGRNTGSGGNTYWDNSAWSDSVFVVGGDPGVNGSTNNMLAYCWHSVDGFSRFSQYTGNGNTDGPVVFTKFRPRLVFIKALSGTENWQVRDTARSTYNDDSQVRLYFNSNAAEGTASTASPIDFLSNGFKVRGSNSEVNSNGGHYVYGAWADVPLKYNNTF